MHIVIIGATGLVGSQILDELLNDQRITQVTILTRKKITSDSGKLNQVILKDMRPVEVESLKIDAEIFICALGTTLKKAGSEKAFRRVDRDIVVSFAKLAKRRQGQSLFIVSARGANKNSMFFYNRVKGEMEQDVALLSLPSVYLLHPSLLIADREEHRRGEAFAISFYNTVGKILPGRLKQKLGTKVEKIVTFVLNEIDAIKPGQHTIENF